MKFKVKAASSFSGEAFLEAENIDQALNTLRTKEEFVLPIIDKNCSWLHEKGSFHLPTSFIIDFDETDECNAEITIHDYYHE